MTGLVERSLERFNGDMERVLGSREEALSQLVGALGKKAQDVDAMMRNYMSLIEESLGSIQAIVAPLGTPAPVVNALAEAIRKAVAEPSFISLAEKTQNTIDYKGPAAFADELWDSFKTNGDLLRALGLATK